MNAEQYVESLHGRVWGWLIDSLCCNDYNVLHPGVLAYAQTIGEMENRDMARVLDDALVTLNPQPLERARELVSVDLLPTTLVLEPA